MTTSLLQLACSLAIFGTYAASQQPPPPPAVPAAEAAHSPVGTSSTTGEAARHHYEPCRFSEDGVCDEGTAGVCRDGTDEIDCNNDSGKPDDDAISISSL